MSSSLSELYKIVFELSDGAFVLLESQDLNILDCSHVFCKLLERSKEELLHQPLKNFCEDSSFLMTDVHHFSHLEPSLEEIVFKCPNGLSVKTHCSIKVISLHTKRYVFLSFYETQNSDPEVIRYLEQQNRELQKINRSKSEFIANISHELRTPLTTVLGWPEIILDSQGVS